MKNAKNIIAVVLMAMTIATYANATNINSTVDEKAKASVTVYTLPATPEFIESPAPQAEKKSISTNKQNAVQKAAIVGLQLKSQSTK